MMRANTYKPGTVLGILQSLTHLILTVMPCGCNISSNLPKSYWDTKKAHNLPVKCFSSFCSQCLKSAWHRGAQIILINVCFTWCFSSFWVLTTNSLSKWEGRKGQNMVRLKGVHTLSQKDYASHLTADAQGDLTWGYHCFGVIHIKGCHIPNSKPITWMDIRKTNRSLKEN